MPHQCTECGHTFPDGSKEMLSGCPDCGGNKFQFKPAAETGESDPSAPPSTPQSPAPEAPPTDSAGDEAKTGEDDAQADARRDVASREELAGAERDASSESPPDAADSDTENVATGIESSTEPDENADMAALRRELDDQFESIKILEPGQYELNLMELYNREEYIIALQEDGQYVIEVPETWLGDDS